MIVVIAGPTGIGKSEVSYRLARRLGTEIISADSMQVYRYFDIGTAKPPLDYRKTVKHHLIDIINPDSDFNAGDFCKAAMKITDRLKSEGKISIIAGGTGLYIKALIEGFSCGVKSDKAIRDRIDKEYAAKGDIPMHNLLKGIDPDYAKIVHPNDKIRISRGLEVFYISGVPYSSYMQRDKKILFDFKYIIIEADRSYLYKNGEERVDRMFMNGLIDEIKSIRDMGYDYALKPFQSIVYKQAVRYINGEIDYKKCIYEAKKDTRHYIKRQITWFNAVSYGEKIYFDQNKQGIDEVVDITEKKIYNL